MLCRYKKQKVTIAWTVLRKWRAEGSKTKEMLYKKLYKKIPRERLKQ